MHEEFSV